MARQRIIRDRKVAICVGVAMVVAGSYLVYDAYEGRGRFRPFLMRMLPV